MADGGGKKIEDWSLMRDTIKKMALSHLTAIRSLFIAMKSVFAYFAYFCV